MQMLPVITLMDPTHVPVTMDIMEMEQIVLVSGGYVIVVRWFLYDVYLCNEDQSISKN